MYAKAAGDKRKSILENYIVKQILENSIVSQRNNRLSMDLFRYYHLRWNVLNLKTNLTQLGFIFSTVNV